MSYVRGGSRGHLESLRIRQQIAAAEVEAAERELAAIQAAELELARLQRRKEQISEALTKARTRTTTIRQKLALPPAIHGGRDGLLEAVKESAAWDKRRRVTA